jgi:hypothetical protein
LASFAYDVKSSSENVIDKIAFFMNIIFRGYENELVELLSRRNENGDSVFSIYKRQKLHRTKITPIAGLLARYIKPEKFKELLDRKDVENQVHNLQ